MTLNNFQDLIDVLSTEVDWSRPSSHQHQIVEQVLQQVMNTPQIVNERIQEIRTSPPLLEALIPHIEYPRVLMDKFPIYFDPKETSPRYRDMLFTTSPTRAKTRPVSPYSYADAPFPLTVRNTCLPSADFDVISA